MDHLQSRLVVERRDFRGSEGANITTPVFSPDSQSLAYFQAGALKRVPITGGVPVVICAAQNLFGMTWSEDGDIFFGQRQGIMRVRATGGDPSLVAAAADGETLYGPQALPNRDSLLFTLTRDVGPNRWDSATIVAQSLSTGARKNLGTGSEARYLATGHLVYTVGDALLAVPFDAATLEVGGAPVTIERGIARAGASQQSSGAANYQVSGDGTLAYVRSGSSRWQAAALGGIPTSTLVWVNRKGEEEPLAAPPRAYLYPRLSPDGSRVAVDVRDEQSEIWIWLLKQQILRPFTADIFVDADPVWSPDGRRIAWTSNRTGAFDLYWQAADGTGAPERLTDSAVREQPTAFGAGGASCSISTGRLSSGRHETSRSCR
jgi:serine/threonine-protein kinase